MKDKRVYISKRSNKNEMSKKYVQKNKQKQQKWIDSKSHSLVQNSYFPNRSKQSNKKKQKKSSALLLSVLLDIKCTGPGSAVTRTLLHVHAHSNLGYKIPKSLKG